MQNAMTSLYSTLPEIERSRKLVDYILLNAYSVNSTGLCNGKAGIALTLFEVANFLKDDYFEEQALELLQESLLSTNTDISFEKGLSGIGYVLLYLIENNLISADFEQLFTEHLNKILITLQKWEDTKEIKLLFKNQRIVLFLDAIPNKDNKIIHFMELFSKIAGDLLEKQFKGSSEIASSVSKYNVLITFRNYLEIASSCAYFNPSETLLDYYTEAYKLGQLVSDFIIGHYIHPIALRYKNKELKIVAEANKYYSIRNLQVDAMFLSERLNLLYILYEYKDEFSEQIDRLEKDLFNVKDEVGFERCLAKNIPPNSFISGYQSGIARFILYWIYKQSVMNKQDCIRFKKIF